MDWDWRVDIWDVAVLVRPLPQSLFDSAQDI